MLQQPVGGQGPWRRVHWIVIAAILVLSGSLGWWMREPDVGIGGDEITYITLSHSLARGHYRDEFLRGTPPHAKYPPGTALWIAGIRQLAGPDVDAIRAANLLLLGLTALLLGDAVRRLVGPVGGVAGVAVTALSAPLLDISGTALSEPLFVCLLVLAFWAALVADDNGVPRRSVVSFAAGLAAFLTRTAGFTVVAGLVVWLLARKRWRAAAVALLASALVIGGWVAYSAHTAARTPLSSTYLDNLRQLDAVSSGARGGLVAQMSRNARAYYQILFGLLGVPTVAGTWVDNVIWVAGLGSCGVVGLAALVRRWTGVAVHLVLAVGLLLLWPWPLDRLLLPLLPLLLVTLLVGAWSLTRRFGPRVQDVTLGLLIVPLALTGLVARLTHDTNHRCDHQDPYSDPRCFSAGARDLVAAARLVRDSSGSNAVVATGLTATVFYFSGHPTLPLYSVPWPQTTADSLELPTRGADLLLLTTLLSRDRRTARALLPGCDRFAVNWRSPPSTLILSQRRLGSGGDACDALRRFLQEPVA